MLISGGLNDLDLCSGDDLSDLLTLNQSGRINAVQEMLCKVEDPQEMMDMMMKEIMELDMMKKVRKIMELNMMKKVSEYGVGYFF